MQRNFSEQETQLVCALLNRDPEGGPVATPATLEFFTDSAISDALALWGVAKRNSLSPMAQAIADALIERAGHPAIKRIAALPSRLARLAWGTIGFREFGGEYV